MKVFKRSLAVILALCMMLGVVPFTAFASENTSAYSNTTFERILHLDCGRKYFTADWIKALINEMAAAGYTHLQLAFGNDGLRFLLDDMSVTVDGTTYSSDNVTAGVQAGNKAYYNAGDVNELTESEMDEIITHAQSMGIEIVPHLNMPGHMDAVLDAIEYVGISNAHFTGYTTSVRSLNLNNDTAVAFAKALLQKYVDYFAAKGCTYFHIGADEFANDAYYGSMGFPSMGSTMYSKFADFVNDCAAIVDESGMTPRAWNDGISYTGYNASFKPYIQITYWSSGWGGYDVASASTLSSKHDMINTHGDYYFILASTGITNPIDKALEFDNSTFAGSNISDPVGSMFCIWCDVPGSATEQEVAAAARITLRKMAAAMQNNNEYSEEIVPGGFNTDGSINYITVENSNVSVTAAAALTGLTVTETIAPAIEGAAEGKVAAWNITPATADGAYTGSAAVAVPVPDGWNTARMGAFVVNADNTVTKLTGAVNGGKYEFTMPHFSVGGVYEAEAAAEEVKDTITEAGTPDKYELDTDGIDDGDKYIIVYKGNALSYNSGFGSVSVTENSDGTLTIVDSTNITNAIWTRQNDGMYCEAQKVYLKINKSSLTEQRYISSDIAFSNYNDGYQVYREAYNTYYLRYTNNGWTGSTTSTGNDSYFELYKYTAVTQTYTINAALQESRITALTVSNDNYTDASWAAYQSALTAASEKLNDVETASYTSEAAANTDLNALIAAVDALEAAKNALAKAVTITIKYVSNGVIVKTETRNVSEAATSVTVANFNANDKFYTVESTTLNITPATVTEYSVTVTESDEDLSAIAPLTIEYWITNSRVTDTSTGLNYVQIAADVSGVHSESGIAFETVVPPTANMNNRSQEYWQTKLLNVTTANDSSSGTQEQTLLAGDDETLSGSAITHVRYWNGKWQAKSGSAWIEIVRTEVTVNTYNTTTSTGTGTRETNQLVAYYMEVVDIKNANGTVDMHINAADWGTKGDGTGDWGYGPEDSRCSVSVQLVYEDGSTNPSSTSATDLKSKTIVYYLDYNSSVGRGLGTMIFSGLDDGYRIYKVTAETGDMTSTERGNYVTVTNLTWDGNEETVWSGEPTQSVSIGNPSKAPNYEAPYDNLAWNYVSYNKNTAILIRLYVKAVETADTLDVHYLDASANNLEFYNYSIPVASGTVFDSGFAMGSDANTLVNNSVLNYYGSTQTVSADLATMPQIAAYYRYCTYTLTKAERSADGKDVYLYYTFTPVVTFVADFGLPIEIIPTDLNQEGYTTAGTEIMGIKVIGTYDNEASTTANAIYGSLMVDGNKVIYTPTEILQGTDFFTIYVMTEVDDSSTNVTNEEAGIAYRVYIVPATTVYYEEGFLFTETDNLNGWSFKTSSSTERTQDTEKLGAHKNNYGYDPAYATNSTSGSSNSCAVATVKNGVGAATSFTFTGTGFELYANSQKSTGVVTVLNEGKVTKLYRIDTKLSSGITGATQYALGDTSNATHYGLPIISETALPYGTYTVQIKQNNVQANTDGRIEIDGVRIINTIADSTVFAGDLEDNPEFYELRDYVLKAVNVDGVTDSEYGAIAEIAKQVYAGISTDSEAPAAVITDIKAIYGNDATAQDLLDNGPKNELYLWPGQSLTFNVSTNRVMQLGLKAPKSEAIFSVTVDGTKKTVGEETTITNSDNESETWRKITSTVDMFYKIADKITNSETTTTHTVTITVNSGLLSVTKLKICDDPNAAFVALTQEDIENALLGIYGLTDDKTPVEPEEPAAEADAVLAITLTDGKKEMGTAELTAVGAEGEKHTFTAEEILNAVLDAMPDLYKVSDESAITDVIVKYGETGELTVDIELEFEFDMDSWWRQVRTLMNRIFTIIADAGNGGSITNEGSADVKFRKDITYTITPDEGYEIESVIVDGKDVGAVSEYTFRRVRNDHRISVTFKEVQ